jgi:hypothetical protein
VRERAVLTVIQWIAVVIAAVCMFLAALIFIGVIAANAWEGDDGGIDAQEIDVGRWGAQVEANATRLNNQMQLTTPPAPPTTQPTVPSWPWDALAQCESGGNWSINTGNGFYGGLQFTLTSWRAVGGTGYPHQHGREEQIRRGIKLQAIQGWGAWPACSRKIGLR